MKFFFLFLSGLLIFGGLQAQTDSTHPPQAQPMKTQDSTPVAIRHDSVRFYSEYLEKGRYQLSYMAQAIAPGSFVVMPMHAEEMYDPDVFGKTTADTLEVQ